MNTQRITVSLPKYLYEDLVQLIPAGRVSHFVAQALENKLMEVDEDPIEEFIALRKKLPKAKKATILKAIKKGRA